MSARYGWVERVLACWLHVEYADSAAARSVRGAGGHIDDYTRRFQEGAHHRFLSAVKVLALVRRMGIPALQVNIGERQFNVVNAPWPSEPPEPE